MKDADMLEEAMSAVKWRKIRLDLSYKERLKRLVIFSLRHRKLGSDMIEVVKMIHGIDKINLGKFFLYR